MNLQATSNQAFKISYIVGAEAQRLKIVDISFKTIF